MLRVRVVDNGTPVHTCPFHQPVVPKLGYSEEIESVFISNIDALYFLEFFKDGIKREIILVPHKSFVTEYSGGYHFGFSFGASQHGYFRPYPPDTTTCAEGLFIGRLHRKIFSPEIEIGGFDAFRVCYDRKKKVKWELPWYYRKLEPFMWKLRTK